MSAHAIANKVRHRRRLEPPNPSRSKLASTAVSISHRSLAMPTFPGTDPVKSLNFLSRPRQPSLLPELRVGWLRKYVRWHVWFARPHLNNCSQCEGCRWLVVCFCFTSCHVFRSNSKLTLKRMCFIQRSGTSALATIPRA